MEGYGVQDFMDERFLRRLRSDSVGYADTFSRAVAQPKPSHASIGAALDPVGVSKDVDLGREGPAAFCAFGHDLSITEGGFGQQAVGFGLGGKGGSCRISATSSTA